jgi:hypothetical protein
MSQPDPKAQEIQQQMQQLQVDAAKWTVEKLKSETVRNMADAEMKRAQAEESSAKIELEDDYAEVASANTVIAHKKVEADVQKAKIDAVMGVQEMQLERERMDHEKHMAKYDLQNQQEIHNQKLEHNEESHKQKLTQSEQMAKQKAKQKPKTPAKK